MEYCHPLHLGVVANENWAFGSPSTLVAHFTFYFYIYFRLQGFRVVEFDNK